MFKFVSILGCFLVLIKLSLFAEIDKLLSLEDEALLPFHAELVTDFLPEGAHEKIPSGFRFTILRMENGLVVADFSRRGIFKIPITLTNIEVALKLIKEEKAKGNVNRVEVPRMAMFLANRIISGETGWNYPIRSDTVNKMNRWYLLYSSSTNLETTEAAIEIADNYYKVLPSEIRSKMAFVYMDPSGNKKAIQGLYKSLEPTIQSMPGYLSSGYSKALGHIESQEELPLLIELASSGRILSKHSGLDAIRTHLSDSARELPEK